MSQKPFGSDHFTHRFSPANKAKMRPKATFLTFLLVVFVNSCIAQEAQPCPTNGTCRLPNCHCSSYTAPGNIGVFNRPQIVFITLSGAITVTNYPIYEELLFDRTNPNGAHISATFFVNHEYANYSLVHNLWRKGFEIGLGSITHITTTEYWRDMEEELWYDEIVEQIDQMARFASINATDLKGMRAPFLQIGGDEMYRAIYRGNVTYESSRATVEFRNGTHALFPYTADYATIQDCQTQPCWRGSYPGVWTVPILAFTGGDGNPCAKVDQCIPIPMFQNDTFDLLMNNFEEIYYGNRAPIGIHLESGWLDGNETTFPAFGERKRGIIQFLDELAQNPDVFIVSITQGLEWMKNPTSLNDIDDFEPWQPKEERPDGCVFPRNCRYANQTFERYMSSCVACPPNYPWVGNPLGLAN